MLTDADALSLGRSLPSHDLLQTDLPQVIALAVVVAALSIVNSRLRTEI